MSDCIWIHYARPRPHWYKLSAAEKDALRAQWAEAMEISRQGGGSSSGSYDVRGQSDYSTVEVWHFPNAQAAFDHWARLTAVAYNEWNAFSNNVGIGA